MNIIEVDNQVADKLTTVAKQLGITRNQALRLYLGIDNKPIFQNGKSTAKNDVLNNRPKFRNAQEELIPYVIKVLYNYGGSATKKDVQNEVFNLLKGEFEKPHYKELVGYAVPRWQKHIAWAREKAKRLGLIKSPEESGRGIWELTRKGIEYYEEKLQSKI